MGKFLTILICLIGAWFSVMIAGYIAVRLLHFGVRIGLTLVAGVILGLAGVFTGSAKVMRFFSGGTLGWASRRWQRGFRADRRALARASVDELSLCGHWNRREAKFCGRCGAALPGSASGAGAGIRWVDDKRNNPDIVFLDDPPRRA